MSATMSRHSSRPRPRGARGVRPGVLAVAYVLTGLALATALAWPLYQTPRLVVVAAVAGLTGAGIAILARALRWPVWLLGAAVAVAYLVEVVPLAVPAGLRSPVAFVVALRDGVAGIVLGWKQLLTLDTPVGDYQAVLVPFFVIALVGTAVATFLALLPGRRAAWAVPVVLAGGVFGVAFAATDPGAPLLVLGVPVSAPREVLLGLVLVAVSLAWLALRSRMDRRAALAEATSTTTVRSGGRRSSGIMARRILLGVGIVAVAGVVGVAAVPAFAGVAARTTLRTGAEPLLVIRDVSTPLGAYRAAFEADAFAVPLFTVDGDTAGIDRLRIATLDAWDGREFRVGSGPDGARFTRLATGTAPAGGRAIDIAIGDGFGGIWMPMPDGVASAPQFSGDRAEALTDGFYLDRASGSAVEIAGDGPTRGLAAGDTYTVVAAPAASSDLGDPSATGMDLVDYPQLSAWLDAQAQPRSAAGLGELLARLRDRGYLSHSLADDAAAQDWIASLARRTPYVFQSSYAGHSAARVETLFRQLLDQQNRVGADAAPDLLVAGVGDDEQFATAGALVARALGYESRVVVGVRLAADPAGGVPACERVCAGGNLAAWIEVRAPGAASWATFDVEPQFDRQPTIVSLGQELPKNPTIPEQTRVDTAQPPAAQRDDAAAAAAASDPAPAWVTALLGVLRLAGLGTLLLLLVILPFLVVVIAKRVRRRARRTAAAPEVAIVAAWEEVVDTWADGGIAAPGRTRRERAAASGSVHAAALAALVDDAVFAPHPPTRVLAERAWSLVDEECGARSAAATPWQRLIAAVSPRSFLRRLEVRPFRLSPPSRRPAS